MWSVTIQHWQWSPWSTYLTELLGNAAQFISFNLVADKENDCFLYSFESKWNARSSLPLSNLTVTALVTVLNADDFHAQKAAPWSWRTLLWIRSMWNASPPASSSRRTPAMWCHQAPRLGVQDWTVTLEPVQVSFMISFIELSRLQKH